LAALCLHDQGVDVGVVDAEWQRPVRGYACGLHPETLRLLDRLSLMPAIRELAHRVDRISVWRGHERVGIANLAKLPGPYPHVLTLRQSDLQDALAQRLAQLGVEVALGQAVVNLTLADDAVCTVALPGAMPGSIPAADERPSGNTGPVPHPGEPIVRRSDYVIAADGYDSACRQALGIPLVDLQEGQAFIMFEFEADLTELQHEAHVALGSSSVCAFWPLGPQLGRWTFQLQGHLDEPGSLELLQHLLRQHAPWFRARPEQLSWTTTSHFERRVADSFGRGRVWLAGDSAHVTSPIGFQNMNRGFVEVSELARIVRHELQGTSVRDGFERFERSQQLEWRRLLGLDSVLLSQGSIPPAEGARLVSCLPASGRDLDALLGQLKLGLVPRAELPLPVSL
jgi:2-polyprenyl-6-methoxyphenol hydroxylase-like FAD-dependent oxidoreductase